jgi:hypothetical protein
MDGFAILQGNNAKVSIIRLSNCRPLPHSTIRLKFDPFRMFQNVIDPLRPNPDSVTSLRPMLKIFGRFHLMELSLVLHIPIVSKPHPFSTSKSEEIDLSSWVRFMASAKIFATDLTRILGDFCRKGIVSETITDSIGDASMR